MDAGMYGVEDETRSIWVFLEHADGRLLKVSLEILGKARRLADAADWPLVALLLGHGVQDHADRIIQYGADEVLLGDHPLLETFTVDAYAHAAFQAITSGKPSITLFGATPNGRDLAGRLAVRLLTGLNADCTDLQLDRTRGVLEAEVTGFGGGILAILEAPRHRPQMATVRPGVFPIEEPQAERSGTVNRLPLDLEADTIRTRIVERVRGRGVDLTQAQILVCGGRGVDGDFATLQELATMLKGEVGATRPPVDEGHIERERQVGQTGVVCRPKLAVCCGISGAFHFVVGIQEAEVVVAINSDPEAPIFEYADYGVVGDAAQILPALIAELKEQQEVAHA